MEEKYFVHPSSFVDDDVEIGEGTKIWYFCHIQKGARIGKHCSLVSHIDKLLGFFIVRHTCDTDRLNLHPTGLFPLFVQN